ncbi:MAG: hypothetical protein P8170_13830, partial [Gemmatimonadota bacterium]
MTRRILGVTALATLILLLPAPAVRAQADESGEDPDQEGLPLAVGRRLQYTAREGSWMSVDVSPDGNTVVFDHLGDLFTVPISGGRAVRLTRGMAFDAQPRFSPDGKH